MDQGVQAALTPTRVLAGPQGPRRGRHRRVRSGHTGLPARLAAVLPGRPDGRGRLARTAEPVMRELSAELEETSHLCVLRDQEVRTLLSVSGHSFRVHGWEGRGVPAVSCCSTPPPTSSTSASRPWATTGRGPKCTHCPSGGRRSSKPGGTANASTPRAGSPRRRRRRCPDTSAGKPARSHRPRPGSPELPGARSPCSGAFFTPQFPRPRTSTRSHGRQTPLWRCYLQRFEHNYVCLAQCRLG